MSRNGPLESGSETPVDPLNAVVTQRTELAPGLFTLCVAPLGWELPEFLPGQYGTLGLFPEQRRHPSSEPEKDPPPAEKLIRRPYSIASAPHQRDSLEFYLNMVTDGLFTPRLAALEVGDRVFLSPRLIGTFTLKGVPDDGYLVLCSTGTGLAPFVSMVRSLLPLQGPRRIAIVHGARRSFELGYRQELNAIERASGGLFTYLPVVSRPQLEPVPWCGQAGHVQGVWKEKLLDRHWDATLTAENTHVFLCGNPAMISGMEEVLVAEGFSEYSKKNPGGTIHVEKYW